MTQNRDALSHPADEEVQEVFRKNGGNLLTTLSAGKQKLKNLDDHLEINGLEAMEAELKHTGVLLVLGHMGNWEILTKLTELLKDKNPLGALYRPLNNPKVNELILSRRKVAGMSLISSKNPAFTIMRLLKKNGVMCILSDQRIGKKGSLASFFGRVTPCSRLAHTLHEKSQAPVFTLSMKSMRPGKWSLEITRVKEPTQQNIMDTLALSMERSLSDCFWFQDRFQEFPSKSLIEAEVGESSRFYGLKPLRGIVESQAIFDANPQIKEKLPANYPIEFWDKGAKPDSSYFAIGSSREFQKACHRVGLKKACLTPERALRVLSR